MMMNRGNHIDEGYRWGRLGLKIYDDFKADAWLCRTSAAFYGAIFARKNSLVAAMEPLNHAYRVGLATGDI